MGEAIGQVLHGSATTTEAVRRAIQHSEESLRALARRHTRLPLDDGFYAFEATIPHLARSALQRHGISRLPVVGSKRRYR